MQNDFQIVTAGIPATADEWFRAQSLPESQLPPLEEADRPRARLNWMSELQYRRRLALRQIAADRERADAQHLGRRIQELLPLYGGGCLESLVRRGQAYEWEANVRLDRNGRTTFKTFTVTRDGLTMDEADFAAALRQILVDETPMRDVR